LDVAPILWNSRGTLLGPHFVWISHDCTSSFISGIAPERTLALNSAGVKLQYPIQRDCGAMAEGNGEGVAQVLTRLWGRIDDPKA